MLAALAFALLSVAFVGTTRAAVPSSAEVAAAAESRGLACDPVDELGGGASHLSCVRELPDGSATNIDVSVTYNIVSADGAGFATVSTYIDPPPSDWLQLAADVVSLFCDEPAAVVADAVADGAAEAKLSGCTLRSSADDFGATIDISPSFEPVPPAGGAGDWDVSGRSTYTGAWTLTAYVTEGDFPEPDYALGDSVAGTLTIDCTSSDESCGVSSTREGEDFWGVGLEVVAPGQLRSVDESELANCQDGQVVRTTHDARYDAEVAEATIEQVHLPRTCTVDNSTLYTIDTTWSFSGTLTEYEPRPADDLEGFLASYGMACTDGAEVTECTLDVTDDTGVDATYDVVTYLDAAGSAIGLDAVVSSLDASLPSDAVSFLRGIAVRSPVDDPETLGAWVDAAASGIDAEPFAAGGWTATWTDVAAGDGRELLLSIRSAEAVPSAAPEPGAIPGEPDPVSPQPEPAASEDREPFADSVPAPSEVSMDPAVLLQSAALAALLVFLMPFPSQLFNSTLEAHEDEVRRWFRLDRIGGAIAGIGAFWASWAGVATFTVLAGTLYGFLDPGFGLDTRSAATVLGMLAGIILVTASFAVPAVLAHRRIGDRWSPKVVPVSLLIGVVCVLLSRLTDFQPGYLYGLLIGLAFARELSAAEEGRATAVGAIVMLAVAAVAWLTLGFLPDGDGFVLTVARTALAALMVAGLEGVVFGLLPMRFLPGAPLYAWNRVLWGALLAVGAFAFFHILINPASGYLSDSSRTPLLTVVGLLVGFSLVSVAFWAWFRLRAEPHSTDQTGAGDPSAPAEP